ncbi:integral membrane sensor signal transduction histidine kinase [Stanieria cyanosphaera PCC 7437]|uniref:histidine kinase n=1 Tax=Stanieria cyanosphaera (strain ATCC 29371 / PCC 7437) TaxID=111780 RepID=K9XSZ8_STAC7|nr:HAMP domain-containing sensor histidine kinase [Stanieria cyanosphaera]AFZ35730.1 integral membrane sensor signal transduction histidine kinase [Stanieria cyanosphaera PCC 7437]
MNKLSLGARLFLSHLIVMIVGLASFVLIAKVSSPRMFIVRLEQLEKRGIFTVHSARTYLVENFHNAWNRGAFWSLIVGGSTAGGLSYLASKRIMRPLKQMKDITYNFAAGNLDQRMPESEIPELNQLGVSFNSMASSIEDVEKRRRELISDLTHELRTPLTVVRGYLEELADGRVEPSPEIYSRLVRETRRLERLIHDLQELSKAEAGYLSINAKKINIRPLIVSLVGRFADQLLEEGPVLKLDCPAELPPVLADLDRTEQILVNLLGNAIRYTEQGSITVKAWKDNRQLWIAIIDTGVGIAQEDLPFVFERFWRADRSRASYSGGTGIGLAITRRLVELQGGKIEVESEVGQGSTFRFCLPIA